MGKSKKKEQENLELQGQTNLAFEPCEPDQIVKTRSKEDISTLNKNLANENDVKTEVTKKKKFKEKNKAERRIDNDLFEEKGKKKKKSSLKKSGKKEENIQLVPMTSTVQEDQEDQVELEINVINDKEAKKKKTLKKTSKKSKKKDEDLEEATKQEIEANDKILGVFVHYADCLKLDFYVLHPVVKVSLVNLATGKLIAKSDKTRKVTSYYEGDHVSHIVQLMTQPYDFKVKKSIVPRWEELLLFNEDPEYLQSFTSNLGIFFEVVDFVRMSSVNNESWRNSHATGWHYIAWAFLKPVPSKNHSNLGKKLRLQLYKPVKNEHEKDAQQSLVWKWWSQCPHVCYPSSLYVTVEPVNPPEQPGQPSIRSMDPLQPEKGSSDNVPTSNQTSLGLEQGSQINVSSPPRVVLWTRLPGQTCKIPDQNLYEFGMKGKGAWCLRFSTDGKALAVASPAASLGSSIKVYAVETGQQEVELQGHKGPIYALDWHRNNQFLSASGDGTVRIWSSKSPRKEEHVLHHPTYVYAARFHPNAVDTVASAGYDQVVRIWQKAQSHYIILHELMNHKAYVNCLEFDIDGQVLFSGDQQGAIRVWESSSPDCNDNWYLKKSLDFKEIQGNAVLALSIHPGGRRLLVHSRSLSHPVIMVDLKLHTIMQNFNGSQSFKGHVSSCITPCGTYAISSSQDGAVYVWNADNGAQTFVYTNPLGEVAAKAGVVINCVHFSPTDHIIAFSGMVTGQHHGKVMPHQFTAPVYVYKNKVNSSSHFKKRSVTLPELQKDQANELHKSLDDEETKCTTGDKFKSMLHQLDQMILDKKEEMENI